MNILIIDDEKIVREGLRKIVEEKADDFTVVGEAPDGTDALELIGILKPHICIVDIRMRHMNGIDFIRKVRERNEKTRFIVLSGYEEFEYARDLISIGCSAYLTKPVKHQELIRWLLQLKDEILAEREKEQRIKVLEHTSTKMLDFQRDLFMRSLMQQGISEESQSMLSKYGVQWLLDSISTAVISAECSIQQMLEAMQFVAVEKGFEQFICQELRNYEYCIIMSSAYPVYEIITACCQRLFESNHIQAVAGLYEKAVDVPLAISNAEHVMRSGFSNRATTVHRFDDLPKKPYKDYEEQEIKIKKACLDENGEELFACVKELLADMQKEQIHMNVCMVLIGRLYLAVRTKLNKTNYAFIIDQIPSYITFEDKINSFRTFEDMRDYVLSIVQEIASILSADSEQASTRIIRKAKYFIKENYERDISLTDIAESVGLNPSYFSVLFKMGTGKTYMNYLTDYRIDKAKDFLLNSTLRVYEIGALVGYADPKYFNRVFRQITGVTPGEFREKQ